MAAAPLLRTFKLDPGASRYFWFILICLCWFSRDVGLCTQTVCLSVADREGGDGGGGVPIGIALVGQSQRKLFTHSDTRIE